MPILCLGMKSVPWYSITDSNPKSSIAERLPAIPVLPASSAWILDHVSSIVIEVYTLAWPTSREEEWKKLPLEARTQHQHSEIEPVLFWRMSKSACPVSIWGRNVKYECVKSRMCSSVCYQPSRDINHRTDASEFQLFPSSSYLQYNSTTTIVIQHHRQF